MNDSTSTLPSSDNISPATVCKHMYDRNTFCILVILQQMKGTKSHNMDDGSLKKSVNEESPKETIVMQEKESDTSQPDDVHQNTFAQCGDNLAALSPDKPSNTRVCNYFNIIPQLTIIQVQSKEQQEKDDSTSILPSPDNVSPATVCKHMYDRKKA